MAEGVGVGAGGVSGGVKQRQVEEGNVKTR